MKAVSEAKERLSRFSRRQVVIAWYEDELLTARDGYTFDTLRFEGDTLLLHRDGRLLLSLDLRGYREFAELPGFKHHYAFRDGERRVELYFP